MASKPSKNRCTVKFYRFFLKFQRGPITCGAGTVAADAAAERRPHAQRQVAAHRLLAADLLVGDAAAAAAAEDALQYRRHRRLACHRQRAAAQRRVRRRLARHRPAQRPLGRNPTFHGFFSVIILDLVFHDRTRT